MALYGLVALTRALFQQFEVHELNIAPTVFNEAGLLKRACDYRDTGATNTKYLCEEFLRQLTK